MRIKSFKLFESESISDKYLMTLTSSNSTLDVKTWIEGKSSRITDIIKSDAQKRWSIDVMLSKITPPSHLKRLSNEELVKLIAERGLRPLRIREDYDSICRELIPKFRGLFSDFQSGLKIEDKIEFLSLLVEYDWVLCNNGEIIKVVDVEKLGEEIDIISGMFGYYLYPA